MNVYPIGKQARSSAPGWRWEEDEEEENADCGALKRFKASAVITAVTSHVLPWQRCCHRSTSGTVR